MKRLWIAVGLLSTAILLCVITTRYQHHQIDRMLGLLDKLETVYASGDTQQAQDLAQQLARDYEQVGRILYCFVAHNDLAESQETVALLPALLRQGKQEEWDMEIARLREQLNYLRGIGDPTVWNIL